MGLDLNGYEALGFSYLASNNVPHCVEGPNFPKVALYSHRSQVRYNRLYLVNGQPPPQETLNDKRRLVLEQQFKQDTILVPPIPPLNDVRSSLLSVILVQVFLIPIVYLDPHYLQLLGDLLILLILSIQEGLLSRFGLLVFG